MQCFLCAYNSCLYDAWFYVVCVASRPKSALLWSYGKKTWFRYFFSRFFQKKREKFTNRKNQHNLNLFLNKVIDSFSVSWHFKSVCGVAVLYITVSYLYSVYWKFTVLSSIAWFLLYLFSHSIFLNFRTSIS